MLNPDNAAPLYAKDADAVGGAAKAVFTPSDDLKVTRRGNIVWTSGTFPGSVTHEDGHTMNLVGRHTGDSGKTWRTLDHRSRTCIGAGARLEAVRGWMEDA